MDTRHPVTHWDRERTHAQEVIASIERERAIEDILQRMQIHHIQLSELRKCGAPEGASCAEPGPKRRGSYDPIFGWR